MCHHFGQLQNKTKQNKNTSLHESLEGIERLTRAISSHTIEQCDRFTKVSGKAEPFYRLLVKQKRARHLDCKDQDLPYRGYSRCLTEDCKVVGG